MPLQWKAMGNHADGRGQKCEACISNMNYSVKIMYKFKYVYINI